MLLAMQQSLCSMTDADNNQRNQATYHLAQGMRRKPEYHLLVYLSIS